MNRRHLLLAMVAGFAALSSLPAQTFEQVAPKTPPASHPLPSLPPPNASESSSQGDRVLVPALLGLVFVGSSGQVDAAGVSVPGVNVLDVPLLVTPDFRRVAGSFLGQPVTLNLLNQLTRDVVLYFRKHDRPVVDVVVPEQNIQSGTVQILVVESRLGAVRAEGNRWFSSHQLTSAIRVRPGDALPGGEILDDVAWLNQNPFRQVDLVFARGTEPATTDLILRTYDRRPWRIYAGYEDSGNDLTDNERVLAGFNLGNLFGRGQLLDYQLTASPDFSKFVAHSSSYVIPIDRWHHTLTFFGSYATSRPELPGGLFVLDGVSWQASARYRVPLGKASALGQALSAGVDFKRSNNNLAFGGAQVFAQSTDVAQAVLVYDFNQGAGREVNDAELTLALSPGGLTSGNHTSDYAASRSYARPKYAYLLLSADHTSQLPSDFSWFVRAWAQEASTNLLGSEQLGFGGHESLRGYDERVVNGDDGFIVANELRRPLPIPFRTWGKPGAGTGLIGLVFLDAGVAGVHQALPGEASSTGMASAGVGVRCNLGTNLTFRADYGWQLHYIDANPRHSRGHVGVVLSY